MDSGIIGDATGIDLPLTRVDKELVDEQKRLAKFSKTKEFKKLKEHIEAKIDFYQKYLPDGRPLTSNNTTGVDWVIANAIIGELNLIIQTYELAAENAKR